MSYLAFMILEIYSEIIHNHNKYKDIINAQGRKLDLFSLGK